MNRTTAITTTTTTTATTTPKRSTPNPNTTEASSAPRHPSPTPPPVMPFTITDIPTNQPTFITSVPAHLPPPSSISVTDVTQPIPSVSSSSNAEAIASSVIAGPSKVTVNRNVPQFLNKLYNMVNDPASNDLIRWSKDGTSFIVQRHEEFAREVLPRFFKHNNFASFVRQLNMYGFHKVPHLQQGVLHSETEELWEFRNEHFQRNQPDLLCLVTRKKGRADDDKEGNSLDIASLLGEINAIKKHQMAISTDLKNMQRDNQVLWQETMAARDRYNRHQDTIDKILRFLATVFTSEKEKPVIPNKKRRLLLVDGDPNQGHEVDFDSYVDLPVPEGKETIKTAPTPNVDLLPEFADDSLLFGGEDSLSSDSLENALPSGQNIVCPIPAASLSPESRAAAFQLLNTSLPGELSSVVSTVLQPTDLTPVQNLTTELQNTTKSVEDIQSDIDALQSNIDSLTSQLGFEPGQELDLSEMENLLAAYGAENGAGALFCDVLPTQTDVL